MTMPTETKVKGLTRDELLAKGTVLKLQAVKLPDIGVVFLREMTGSERGRFEVLCVSIRGQSREVNLDKMREKLLVRCICSEDGTRLFKDDELEVVGKIGAAACDLLFEEAQKINGLAAKDVKDLTEGLGKPQAGASPSV